MGRIEQDVCNIHQLLAVCLASSPEHFQPVAAMADRKARRKAFKHTLTGISS